MFSNASIALPHDPVAGLIDAIRGRARSVAQTIAGVGLVVFAITAAICNSFKLQLLTATHDFTNSTGDTFKLALYTSAASLDKTTTAYTSSGEVGSSGSYVAGGGVSAVALASLLPVLSGDTACLAFSTLTFTSATITARGALIYNYSKSNKAVCVLNFGSDQTSTAGNFTITFPAQTAGNAIVQLV